MVLWCYPILSLEYERFFPSDTKCGTVSYYQEGWLVALLFREKSGRFFERGIINISGKQREHIGQKNDALESLVKVQ